MPSRLFLLIALLCLSPVLHAQSGAPARYQIYGGYSFLSNSLNGVPGSHQPLNGWVAAVAFPSWHSLRFKLDTYAYRGTNLGAPQHALFIMGVFVEGLGGTGSANKSWAANNALGQTASFAALVGGGLDTRLTRRIAFRVEGGFQYSYFALAGQYSAPYRIPGLPTDFGRVSSGLVWQF